MTMNRFRPYLAALLVLLSLAPVMSSESAADSVGDKKKELQRIKRKMEEKKRTIRKAGKRERSILGEIERIDRAIQAKNADLAREQQRLRDAEAALARTEKEAAAVGGDLTVIRRRFRDRLRALYKMGRSGYAIGILSSGSMTDAVKRLKYLEIVAEQDRRVMRDYREALTSLSQRQAEIGERKSELARRRKDTRARQNELTRQRRKKSNLLSSVRREKKLSRQVLEELEESSRDLWALIKKEEEARRRAKRAAAQRRGAPAAAVPSLGRGRLPWPANGKVITHFGRQRHPKFGTVIYSSGIEIAVREGVPVKAVGTGSVAFADWYKGYGRLLILDHGKGLYSLYGFLSRLDVRKGETVATGQVIGLSGDTGSLRGAKLYFEIRRRGRAEDPLAWLAPGPTARRR